VHGVFTSADLAGLGAMPCLAAVSPLIVPPRFALAVDRVRHVGDPVAFIVADSPESAREAAERVEVEYKSLPAVVDGRAALDEGAPQLWPQAPRNTAFHIQKGDSAAVAAAMKQAAHIVEVDVMNNRVVVAPIEPRAGIARYDDATGGFDLELTGQGLHGIRRQLAEFVFKLPPDRFHLHAPDVGGGFGTKNFLYPEWILLLWAARRLGRPVRWEADRAEEFVSSAQGRDIAATARLGLDRDGRCLALDIAMVANHGAYLSGNGPGAAAVAASTAQGGVYDIPAIAVDIRGAFTNTVPVDAYRGAGKPEANYIVERCIEAAARQLGRDPAALRRQNLIASFPHRTALGMNLDSGGFVDNLDRAVQRADVAGFEARRAAASARGKLLGLGIGCFLETSRGAPNEGAEVRFETDGTVTVAVGTESNGQGHETAYAQIAAERLGVPMPAIRYVQADTRAVRSGAGHGGARSMHMGGTAAVKAIDCRTRARPRHGGPSAAGGRGRAGARGGSLHGARQRPAHRAAGRGARKRRRAGRACDEHDRRLHLPERLPRRRSRGRSGDRRGGAGALHRGRRLRPADQSHADRRPGPGRRDPGHRPGAARAHGLRPGLGPAAERLVHRLRPAARRRPAGLRHRAGRAADQGQSAGRQGLGPGRLHRRAADGDGRRARRAAARGVTHSTCRRRHSGSGKRCSRELRPSRSLTGGGANGRPGCDHFRLGARDAAGLRA
jgi:CO/xanthine dehydrogenase Mo-binding subunit